MKEQPNSSDVTQQISDRQMISLRLSQQGRHLLRERAEALGISQAAVIELLLRSKVSEM